MEELNLSSLAFDKIKVKHLSFLSKKKAPHTGAMRPVEVMENIYRCVEKVHIIDADRIKVATDLYEYDILCYSQMDDVSLQIAKDVKRVCSCKNSEQWYFITIGFNEQTITPNKMKEVTEKVSKLKYFKSSIFVLEKHRENGIHHHSHILVKMVSPLAKSKVIQYVFQTAGMKAVCLGKNFIDVRGSGNNSYENYEKYINGDKKDEKLKYCEMDRKWRLENNL